jgi:hypothetical protein
MSKRHFSYLSYGILSAIAIGLATANVTSAKETDLLTDAPALSLQSPLNDSQGGILYQPNQIREKHLQKIGFRDKLSDLQPDARVAIQQAANPANSSDLGLGVTARIGTLGIGLEAAKSIIPQVNARLGVNFGNVGFNRTDSGIQYDSKLELSSVHLFGDYYPIGGSNFRVTGGFVSQNNKFSVTGVPQGGTYTINGIQYNASDVGTLTGQFKYGNSIAPYLGLGFGQPSSEGLAFNFDLGVMFTGSPQVSLNVSNPTFNSIPGAQDSLNAQIAQTQNDLKGFNVYPVLSVGVSYGF